MAAHVGWRPVALGNLDDEGTTYIAGIVCTREMGDPFRRDALSKPVRLPVEYRDDV